MSSKSASPPQGTRKVAPHVQAAIVRAAQAKLPVQAIRGPVPPPPVVFPPRPQGSHVPRPAQAKLPCPPQPERAAAPHVQRMRDAAQAARPLHPVAAPPVHHAGAPSGAVQRASVVAKRKDFGEEIEALRKKAEAFYFPAGLPETMRGPRAPTLHHKISNARFRILEKMLEAGLKSSDAETESAAEGFRDEMLRSSVRKKGLTDFQVVLDSIPFNLEYGPNATMIEAESQAGDRFDPSTRPVLGPDNKPTLLRQLTPVSAELKGLNDLITGKNPTAAEWEKMTDHLSLARIAADQEKKLSDQVEIMRRAEQWRLQDSGRFTRLNVDGTAGGAYGEEAENKLAELARAEKERRRAREKREAMRLLEERSAVEERIQAARWLPGAAHRSAALAKHYAAALKALGITVAKTKQHGPSQPPNELRFRNSLQILLEEKRLEIKLPAPLTPQAAPSSSSAAATVASSTTATTTVASGSATALPVAEAKLATVTPMPTTTPAVAPDTKAGGGPPVAVKGPTCRFIIAGRCRG